MTLSKSFFPYCFLDDKCVIVVILVVIVHIVPFVEYTVSEDQCRAPSKEHYGNEVYLTG